MVWRAGDRCCCFVHFKIARQLRVATFLWCRRRVTQAAVWVIYCQVLAAVKAMHRAQLRWAKELLSFFVCKVLALKDHDYVAFEPLLQTTDAQSPFAFVDQFHAEVQRCASAASAPVSSAPPSTPA